MQMKMKKQELVKADYELGGKLTRTIVMAGAGGRGRLTVTELDSDTNVVTIVGGEPGPNGTVSVQLDAERLWNLVAGVAMLFGGQLLDVDSARKGRTALAERIGGVLARNEARCLDDDIDREVVLRELVKALSPDLPD